MVSLSLTLSTLEASFSTLTWVFAEEGIGFTGNVSQKDAWGCTL